ncbi:MAG: hypothetical protein V4659_02420 [Pseudomonadota bacterium]
MADRKPRGTPWTVDEDGRLRQLVAARGNASTIANVLGRTVDAVRGRAQALGLPLSNSKRPWRT